MTHKGKKSQLRIPVAAPAMNARDTTKVYMEANTGCGPTLYNYEYIGSVTTTTHQEKAL